MTDPSYFGQSVVMTCTQIGNTGINFEEMESKDGYLGGFIVRQLTPRWVIVDAWLEVFILLRLATY